MILAGNDIDVVVSDERMPGMTGSQFLSEVRKQWPNTIRMILSGQADLEAAVRAINEGEVYRFLLKPCHPNELQMTILQGLQHKKLVAQSRKLLQEHQKNMNLLEELEKANPGITKIELDEDGAISLEDDPAIRGRAVAARRSREGNGEGRQQVDEGGAGKGFRVELGLTLIRRVNPGNPYLAPLIRNGPARSPR